jgi:large subunit ribosomal protein L5
MTLGYVHKPPGTITTPRADRLRTWDESSPYHKGRPKRGPRGPGEVLRVVEKDINWRNVPKIEAVVVHTMTRDAQESSAYLHVAGIMLQAITGARPTVHRVKHPVAQWNLRVKNPISLTSTIRGDQAYDFVDKCISLVLPRIKDWEGVRGK